MKRNFLIVLLGALLFGACCVSCDVNTTPAEASKALSSEVTLDHSTISSFTNVGENSYGREQLFTETSQSHFNKVQPPKMLPWSLEREQLNERNLRWNDPNKVSYIYLLSDMGTIIGYFPIKGKVSSVNSKLTTNQQMIRRYNTSSSGSGVVESPSMDGSYGSNGDAVFFFLSDGTYMEWAGKYLLCDNYIKLTQKPVLTYTVTD